MAGWYYSTCEAYLFYSIFASNVSIMASNVFALLQKGVFTFFIHGFAKVVAYLYFRSFNANFSSCSYGLGF